MAWGFHWLRGLALLCLSACTMFEEETLSFSREGAQVTQARSKAMRKSPEVACREVKKWRKWRRGSWPTCVVGELCGKVWGVSSFSFKEEIHPTFPLLCYTTALVSKSFRHLEDAVLNVHSYSLKSVGIKDFWWEWQRGPLQSCTPLACDMNRACCVNVVLCSFQGHLLFSG